MSFVVWVLFVLAGCTAEPAYQGRPLWLWRKELKHPDATARCRAAAVFAVVRPPVREAIPDLIQCLRDNEQAVRAEAAVALGQMGPLAKDAVPALTKLLNDPALRVRDAAVEALKKIGGNGAETSGRSSQTAARLCTAAIARDGLGYLFGDLGRRGYPPTRGPRAPSSASLTGRSTAVKTNFSRLMGRRTKKSEHFSHFSLAPGTTLWRTDCDREASAWPR